MDAAFTRCWWFQVLTLFGPTCSNVAGSLVRMPSLNVLKVIGQNCAHNESWIAGSVHFGDCLPRGEQGRTSNWCQEEA